MFKTGILLGGVTAAVLVSVGAAVEMSPIGGAGLAGVQVQIRASDEEWKVIGPKLRRVMAALAAVETSVDELGVGGMGDMGGRGGRGMGPGGPGNDSFGGPGEGGRGGFGRGGQGNALDQIADTGVGIAAEDQPHVFERFFRADKVRSREAGGSGLGLAICQSIVEAHRGSISFISRPGSGTTFTVRLPLSHQAERVPQKVLPRASANEGNP